MECLKCKNNNSSPTVQCDSCQRTIHTECSGLSASELKVMSLRGKRSLKFFCDNCLEGLSMLPKLNKRMDELQVTIDQLKIQIQKSANVSSNNSATSEETLINEIYERQKRANNAIFFNVPENRSPDIDTVKDIVKEVTNEELNITNVFRMGKKKQKWISCNKSNFFQL